MVTLTRSDGDINELNGRMLCFSDGDKFLYDDNLKFSDHLRVKHTKFVCRVDIDDKFNINTDLNNFPEHEFQTFVTI